MADARFRRRRKTPRLSESVAPPRGRSAGRLILWLLGLGLAGAMLGASLLVGLFLYYGSDPALPSLKSIGEYQPPVVTRVLDKDGEVIGEIYEERRTVVPRQRIPEVMVHAIVDAEDAQFFEHKGLNYWGMVRAILNNLRPGAHLQGASTITQQLVKNFLLKTNERTIKRKVQEALLAHRLEQQLSKDEILYLYLNQIYFGHQRYGVEEAARFFFGKSISDVDAGESALLASLPKGPEEISPLRHPERAKDRQRYVLSQMLRYNHISRADADRFANLPIQVVRQPSSTNVAPEFVDEVKKELVRRYGDKRIPYLGLTVRTTCDSRVQKLAREALEKNLEALDERQGYRKPTAHLKNVTAPEIKRVLAERALRSLRQLVKDPTKAQRQKWLDDREKALLAGKVTEAVVVEVRPQSGDNPGVVVDAAPQRAFLPAPLPKKDDTRHDRYNPKALPVEKRFAVGDVISVRVEPTLGRIDLTAPEARPKDKEPAAAPPPAATPPAAPAAPPAKPVAATKDPAKRPPLAKGKAAPAPAPAADDEDDEAQPGGDESEEKKGLPVAVSEFGPQGAAVVIDPTSREVRALVGGYGFRRGSFDRALQARRQPGSSFKPFLYAAAFKSDQKFTPATILNDSPQIFEIPGLQDWKPKNAESHEFLGPVRLRTALAKSLNTVAAQIIYKIGAHPVAEMARACGIESKLEETLALGLGASGVSLLELTNAYTTFDAQGRRAAPALLTNIDDKSESRDQPVQALDPEVAFLVTSMMQSVIDEGTAASAKGKLKRPAAGKTGTTTSERDAWFVGFTPDLVAGVWVGFDDMRDLGHGEQGARSALPVWVEIMNGALKGVPPSPFSQPSAIEVRKIDPVTGLLAPPAAPNALDEYFLPGTAPEQVAPQAGEQNPDNYMIEGAQ